MTAEIRVKLVTWSAGKANRVVDQFLNRPAFDPQAELVAGEVLATIRAQGVPGILRAAEQFDGVKLAPRELRVDAGTLAAAVASTPPRFLKAIHEARRRVVAFAEAGIKPDWLMPTADGGTLGERFVPFDRVGVYIPGGEAPLASTALMTIPLAVVAGVREIVACTPCDADKQIDPVLLAALQVAGATEVYRVGGIQAIGLMAYGAKGIPPVQKIVGPGGPYVTAAKRLVYGDVSLDQVAGPSEIAILADTSAPAKLVAADMLSQAEHGTGWEKAMLITTSRKLAAQVAREVVTQTATLPRATAVRRVIERGMLIVVVGSLRDGMALCNQFAPEHLELMVREPARWLQRVQAAGAVFLGPWTPESAGDFVAGPSHVLPTGGAAAKFSGLSVDDFRRRMSVVAYTQADLRRSLPTIEAFGEIEGLEGHARSARYRFDAS
ncbi:MAG: histidinol dehydrogenase [Verrucomicrobia bacterium]|nr:histidinol dehydrogenase [Verrucomicrobiota bacterium]